jgi:DNA-binding transcriptional LysR family regulator
VDFRQLTTFVQVARLGSLSKAADRLRTAQPALSRQIRILEADLQVSLFDRHGRGMTLTDAGEHLLARAEFLLRQMDEIRAEMPERGKEVRGRCCLGVPPTVGDVIAARLIQRFHAAYPSVSLRVVPAFSGYLLDFLHRGEVDLAIIYGASRRSEIDLAPLFEEQLFLVGPRAAGLAIEAPITLARVAAHKLILPSMRHGLRALIEEATRRSDLRLNVPIEVDALQTLKDLVIQQVGYTILPLASVGGEIEAGKLTASPIIKPQLRRSLVLANQLGRPMSEAVRLFRDMLIEEFA